MASGTPWGASRWQSAPRLTPATTALIALNVVVFAFSHDWGEIAERLPQLQLTYDTLRGNFLCDYSTYAPAIASDGRFVCDFTFSSGGQWWRIFTGAALHAHLMHLGFNCLIGFLIGRRLELQLAAGSGRWAAGGLVTLVYVASAAGGSAGAMLLNAESAAVGASGAVFGLMGCAFVAELLSHRNPMQTGLGSLIVLNVLISFIVPGVSTGGHLGGLVVGGLCGLAIGNFDRRRPALLTAPLLMALGVGATAAAWLVSQTWADPLIG